MLKDLKTYIITGAFVLGAIISYDHGYESANTKWKQEVQSEYIKTTEATARSQEAISAISAKYQNDLKDLSDGSDGAIDALSGDNERLRVKLRATASELKDNGGCLIDGKAELDRQFAQRLIRVTQRGDLWIEALQDTIKELQGGQQLAEHKEVTK